MKKLSIIIFAAIMAASLCSCSGGASSEETSAAQTSQAAIESQTQTAETTAEATQTTTQTTTETTTETTTKETTTKETTTKETTTKKKKNSIAVNYKDCEILPNDDMKKVIKKIGAPKSSPTKSASCLDVGYDMIYSYPGFEIESFVDEDGNETIISIEITNKSIEVGNGLKLGGNTKKAIKSSGLDFEDEDGAYIYSKNSVNLTVFDDGGKIDSIFLESTKF